MRQKLTKFFSSRYVSLVLLALSLSASNTVHAQFPLPYCNVFFDWDVEPITLVNFAGINNSTSATVNGTPGVQNFLNLIGNVTLGSSYPITVKGNTAGSYTNYFRAYIDWNQNNVFTDPGESYNIGSITSSSGTDALQAVGTIAVPLTALPGNTRMRVFKDYDAYPPNPCTSNYGYGQVEDYTISVSGGASCATVTFPASATTGAAPNAICLSGNVALTMTPVTAMPAASGITYQWQSAPAAAGPWTNIGTPTVSPTYNAAVTVTSYFRVQVLCNGSPSTLTATASPVVTVTNPGTPTVTPGSRCGPGIVALTATPPAAAPTATLNWYTTATGGAPIGTGASFNTPFIANTTTFHVSASAGGFSAPKTLPTITTGGNGCTGGTMFNLTPTVPIVVDSFKAMAYSTLSNATVNVYTRTGTYLGNETSNVGWTLVTTVTVNTVANTLFNIVLPTSLNLTSGSITGIYLNYDAAYTTMSAPQTYTNADLSLTAGAGLCSLFGGLNANRAFNGSVHYRTAGCEGNRVPVLATVNTSPVVGKSVSAVVCNDEITTIALTPPSAPYASYTWTPVTNLYTNATATTPYLGGSATTLYMKTTNVGQQTYYMMAGNPAATTGCTFADTISIWSQPGNVAIAGAPDSICVSGTSTLSLMPGTGYAPGSIQWQESTNGTTYNNITGATGVNYTTSTLIDAHYYRALIKSTNDTCEAPVKYTVVVNPILLGATDSFNCGPGTVTLQAQTGGNSTAKWYTSATGGTPIGAGSPWTTPYLASSEVYYVAAEGGAGGGAPITVQVGNGTASSGGGSYMPGPFSIYYGRSTLQFMYTAAEVIASGGNPGNITSVAFNCTGTPFYAIPNYTVSIKFVPSSMATLTWQGTGMVQVANTTNFLPTTTGWKTFAFNNNQQWNGTDNIVVQVCWNQVLDDFGWESYDASGNHQYTTKTGRFLYTWTDSYAGTSSCGETGYSTSTELPNVRFGMQEPCQSPRQMVNAFIHPYPIVDLGENINKCVDEGAIEVLNAGVQPNNPTFLWDNQTTGQVRAVSNTGAYSVIVTNSFGCKGYDTISVTLRDNPKVELGNDTTVCNGVTLNIDAGDDGVEYFWNTGAVSQSIDVNTPGTYNVFVTNGDACTKADTITVNMQGELPSISGIGVNNNGQYTFQFTAINPENVIGYDWDFGDSSLHDYSPAPIHTYPNGGNYIVVLRLSSSCGFQNDSTSAHIVGVHQIDPDNKELSVYPNPTKGHATILSSGALRMERIEIYNVLGQRVYSSGTDNQKKHTLDLTRLASGVYTIQVFTDKGNIARKLEILK